MNEILSMLGDNPMQKYWYHQPGDPEIKACPDSPRSPLYDEYESHSPVYEPTYDYTRSPMYISDDSPFPHDFVAVPYEVEESKGYETEEYDSDPPIPIVAPMKKKRKLVTEIDKLLNPYEKPFIKH